MDGFGPFSVMIVVVFLGLGAGQIGHSVRQIRRGKAVTPRDIARFERAVRRQGGKLSPDTAEIFVLAARVQKNWLRLGVGAGTLFIGMCLGVYLALGGDPGPNGLTFMVVFEGSIIALFPGAAVGALVGFSQMKREPHSPEEKLTRPRLSDYCSPFAVAYPVLVLFVNLALMSILVLRLTPNLDRESLARAFALPGMWSVPVVPAILLVLVLATMVIIRRFGDLPLISLPRDVSVRWRVDNAMRKVAIWLIIAIFSLVTLPMGTGQFVVLTTGYYSFTPLYMARMEGWYLIYLGVMVIITLTLLVLIRTGRIARPFRSARSVPTAQPT